MMEEKNKKRGIEVKKGEGRVRKLVRKKRKRRRQN